MAAKKYIKYNAGDLAEQAGTVVSAGAGNDGDIPALDPTGRLDNSVMPIGIAADTLTAPSTENLAAGAIVQVYSNAGVLSVRNADASAAAGGKRGDGFVITAVTSPANALVYLASGRNTGVTGLTIGSRYFLSDTTPGAVTTSAPASGAGHLSQYVGKAVTATELNVDIDPAPIILA